MTVSEGRTRAGASELMRSLGLYVDGPARWGNPVPSRAPGVFVVELPGGADEPPIDQAAVARWIRRVPGMLIDGEVTTAPELARRLGSFWLPGEPIVYVGRSAKTIGGRLAAIAATPLGDARPSAAANWLKALSLERDLRVWWAETDAQEEFEDALLEAVAARNEGALPFANVARPSGERRDDGLRGTLLAEESGPAGAPPARPAGKAAPARRAAARRPAAGATRTTPAKAAARSAPEPTYVSADGLERLTAELEHLRTEVRPQVIARVKAARELGDLRENADYEYARKEQSFVEGRIQALEQVLRTSVVIEAQPTAGGVHLGSTVVVEADGDEATYLLVGPTEADPAAGRISNASPVGRALLGARAGDEVTVQLPAGTVRYRVREVR